MRFKIEIRDGKGEPYWKEFEARSVRSIKDIPSFAAKETARMNAACREHLFQASDYHHTGRIRLLVGGPLRHDWRLIDADYKMGQNYIYQDVRCSKCHMNARRVGYITYSYICTEKSGKHHMGICKC